MALIRYILIIQSANTKHQNEAWTIGLCKLYLTKMPTVRLFLIVAARKSTIEFTQVYARVQWFCNKFEVTSELGLISGYSSLL